MRQIPSNKYVFITPKGEILRSEPGGVLVHCTRLGWHITVVNYLNSINKKIESGDHEEWHLKLRDWLSDLYTELRKNTHF